MSQLFGIDGAAVAQLKPDAFTTLVNALLHAERAKQGLPFDAVSITGRINDADGGIDALFTGSHDTEFPATGESAWQFKLTGQGQDKTKDEVAKPGPARVLAEGGHYYLALAEDATATKAKTRLTWLQEAVPDPTRVHVLNGSAIAAWASRYPAVIAALGLTPHLRGLRSYNQWREFKRPEIYVPSAQQTRLRAQWTRQLLDGEQTRLRLEGPAGVGKTRTVFETLADTGLSPLVVYAQLEEHLSVHTLDHFIDNGLPVIVVVDSCTRQHHEQLAERIPDSCPVRLITIGDEIAHLAEGTEHDRLAPMDAPSLRQIVGHNHYPRLTGPQVAFAADNAGGSVKLAFAFAERMLKISSTELGELTRADDIVDILKLSLPSGTELAVAMHVALFQRVGWDGEIAHDGQALAAFSGISPDAFSDWVAALGADGLVTRTGRYRSVTPQPLAVYLASLLWKQRGRQIAHSLLPALTDAGRASLLARAAELGQFAPASEALGHLFTAPGLFSSITMLEETRSAAVLRYLAVIDPRATLAALENITDIPRGQLVAARTCRRDLMWAAEKCVWHSALFRRGADLLLRLALAENEAGANNATGEWISLFKARLPATAARPTARLAYLKELAHTTTDLAVRHLIIEAVKHGVAPMELHASSGELQYGHVPEPQGGVQNEQEDLDYRRGLFAILRATVEAADDTDLSRNASQAFLTIFRGYLSSYLEALAIDELEWLAARDPQAVRLASHHWIKYRKHDKPTKPGWSRIKKLLAAIAPGDAWSRLLDLALRQPWDFRDPDTTDDEVTALFAEPVQALRAHASLGQLLDKLVPLELPSAWLVGQAIAATSHDPAAEFLLVAARDGASALELRKGFVHRLDRPETRAILDGALQTALKRKALTSADAVRSWLESDASTTGRARVRAALDSCEVSLDQIGPLLALCPWLTRLDSGEFIEHVDLLTENAQTTGSTTPLLFLLAEHLRLHPSAFGLLRTRLESAVLAFPLGADAHVWAEMCLKLLPESAPALARRIATAAASGAIYLDQTRDEARVFNACLAADPVLVWEVFVEALRDDPALTTLGARYWIHIPPAEQAVIDWIGQGGPEGLARARLTATLIPIHNSPSALATYLLNEFTDDRIDDSLAAAFTTSSMYSNYAHFLRGKLAQLAGWEESGSGVRRWARKISAALRARLADVEQAGSEGF